jgi:NAD(P)-dependent dehydrogenase (short-subunit alcohol dehydrogenase family)
MTRRLEDKVAVITGGNSGIGLATAKEFANQGAQVVLLARDQDKLNKAIAEIGHAATGYIGDVTDLNSLKSLYENVANDFGKVDIIFASAGLFEPTMLEDTDEAKFVQVSDVNFKGAFFTVKYAVPYLNKGASVILVSSCLNEMGLDSQIKCNT